MEMMVIILILLIGLLLAIRPFINKKANKLTPNSGILSDILTTIAEKMSTDNLTLEQALSLVKEALAPYEQLCKLGANNVPISDLNNTNALVCELLSRLSAMENPSEIKNALMDLATALKEIQN